VISDRRLNELFGVKDYKIYRTPLGVRVIKDLPNGEYEIDGERITYKDLEKRLCPECVIPFHRNVITVIATIILLYLWIWLSLGNLPPWWE